MPRMVEISEQIWSSILAPEQAKNADLSHFCVCERWNAEARYLDSNLEFVLEVLRFNNLAVSSGPNQLVAQVFALSEIGADSMTLSGHKFEVSWLTLVLSRRGGVIGLLASLGHFHCN